MANFLIDAPITDPRLHYFPELGDYKKAGGKIRLKKYFGEEEVKEGWNFSQNALRIADDSMNKNSVKNWQSSEERDKRWVQMEVLHKLKKLTDDASQAGKNKYKIYVFYNENNLPIEDKIEIETKFNDWIKEDLWTAKVETGKIEKMCSRLEKMGECTKCGSCETKEELAQIPQVAQIPKGGK